MTAELWVEMTNKLVGLGLLNPKVQGRATTIADGHDMRWLFDRVREHEGSSPTPQNS
jgi:hypothetical protein